MFFDSEERRKIKRFVRVWHTLYFFPVSGFLLERSPGEKLFIFMAASSSKEAHHIPLPPSPSAAQEPKASTKKKGKQGHTKRRVPPKSAVATKTPRVKIDSGSDWDWTPLTDSHVSKVPPLFTKDGR